MTDRKAFLQHIALQTLKVSLAGGYWTPEGDRVDLSSSLARSMSNKVSIPPDLELAPLPQTSPMKTRIQVTEETTLQAAERIYHRDEMPLALNFANGVQAGGGFLLGADAQEESLCRCSSLYMTLIGDPMYRFHKSTNSTDSSDWAILSPEVPVFATEEGVLRSDPWTCGFLTCAAPIATAETKGQASELMVSRIDRVLHIAQHYGYGTLVLGAWGCGAFGNDPERIAGIFQHAMQGRFMGQFDEVVFAISDPNPKSHCHRSFQATFPAV